jgi:tetratricopeptide (TPR) repeat protein
VNRRTTSTAPAPEEGAARSDSVPARDGNPFRKRVAALGRLLRNPRLWAAALLLGLAVAGLALTAPYVRGWYHLRAARAELERYHNPQAIRHLQVCLHLWPDDPEVLLPAARAARRARVYADADLCLVKYQRARGIDDALNLEQLLLSAERNVDQVSGVCRRHVEEGDPNTPLILEALARGYLWQYRLVEARTALQRWKEAQPDNAQVYCLEGQLHFDYARVPRAALDSYRRAVQLDPANEEARLGVAITALQAKLFAEAEEQLLYMRKCQPDNLRVQVALAECRYALGDREQAVRLVDDVLAQQPRHPSALALRGRLALEGGQPEQAENWLRQAVQADPENTQARYNFVLCLNQNGKDEESQEQNQILKQKEDDLKRFNDVVNQELMRRPLDPALHCELGQLLLRGGHVEEGLRWLHSALSQDPNYAPARQALAEHYQKARGQRTRPEN